MTSFPHLCHVLNLLVFGVIFSAALRHSVMFVSIKIYYFSSAQLLVNTNIHSGNHSNSITDRHASHAEAVIQTEHQKEDKGDLHDFKHGVVVGARRDGLSISKIPDLLEFSHTSTSLQ